jgi:hypothetical protein
MDSDIRVELYLRSYTPTSEPQNAVIEAVETLRDRGTVDDYEVLEVPKAVRRGGQPSRVERRFRRFRDWAARTGYDVSRPFRVRSYENQITGETVEQLVTPVVSMAVYEDGDLAAVLPCEDEDRDRHVAVRDYLSALTNGEDPLETLDAAKRRRHANT